MSALDEYQFEILPSVDAVDGQVFGIGSEISTNEDGFHPGSTSWSTQDSASEATGNVVFGKDRLSGPVWGWDLHVDREDTPTAVDSLARFTTAWRAHQIRQVTGAVLPLRYLLGGRVRRIYGRPGSIDNGINNLLLNGYADITCDFQAIDGYTYDDVESSRTFQVGESELGASGGGFTFPLTFPYGPAAPTEQVTAGLVIGGDAPTGFRARLVGPWTSPGLQTADWTLSFPGITLADGQYIDVDTRPWAATAILSSGASIGGALGRRQSLSTPRLQPGPVAMTMLGSSSTGTASCTLRWANAHNSL